MEGANRPKITHWVTSSISTLCEESRCSSFQIEENFLFLSCDVHSKDFRPVQCQRENVEIFISIRMFTSAPVLKLVPKNTWNDSLEHVSHPHPYEHLFQSLNTHAQSTGQRDVVAYWPLGCLVNLFWMEFDLTTCCNPGVSQAVSHHGIASHLKNIPQSMLIWVTHCVPIPQANSKALL